LSASVDGVLSEDDVVLTRVPVSANIAPGRSATLRLNVAYPPQLLPGFHTLVAKMDPQGVLGEEESLRLNNVAIATRSIRAS
jgi:hypothetical protein